MWRRLRSLSRSHRRDSPAESDSNQPESIHKPSGSLGIKSRSRAHILGPASSLGEEALDDSLGLSVLHTPEETPAIDLIFVHGLGGASIKTWCKGHDQNLCWPKYWLPEDLGLNNVRVLTFGYNTEILSKTKTRANISDFAKSLLAEMKYGENGVMKDLGVGRVSILFVAHSMGGLVVKKAYLRGRIDRDYENIVAQIKSIFFLSTPHRGSNLAETLDNILSTSVTSYSRKIYITELTKNSSTIEELNEDFRHQISNLELYSFYELQRTIIKGSLSAIIVAKDSSLLGHPEEKSIPLDADHHSVCKYADRKDVNYRSVVSILKTVISKYVNEAEICNAAKTIESLHKVESLLSIYGHPEEDYHALRDRWTPGTCEGLLQNKTFTAWLRKTTAAGILWMYAGPGSGNSIKSSFLINHLTASGYLCQYYFFKYEDTMKRSANMLFRSLAYQISQDMPSFRLALMKLADERAYNGRTESRQLWKTLFESILFSLNLNKPLFWIIDAIDESDSITSVISSLKQVPSTLPIRIIILSRKLPAISTALSRASDTIPVDAISIDNNHNDIHYFVQKEVRHLPGDSNFHAVVVEQLVRRSEGNFLWVRLVLEELLEIHSQEDLGHALDEIPPGMVSMYQQMESTIGQLSKASDLSLARTLLTWVTYGKRLLHIHEFMRVLQPEFPSLVDLRSSINQVCGHFVTVDSSDRVSLIHSTARDYLRHASKLPFPLESRSAHKELCETSLQVLLDPQLRSRLSQKTLPTFCEYASTSWAYHLDHSSVGSDDILSMLARLFEGPFVLPWIEALVISRQLGGLVYASTILTSMVLLRRRSDAARSPPLHHISDLRLFEIWALDLLKVVGKFGSHLLQDSAAIYKFIPQLCPPNPALYQQFRKSSLSQISVSGLSTADWDDLSSRLSIGTSHRASLIRCSSHYLAISTSANIVILWNTVTFEEILSLNHDEHVFQICFNGSGDRLVSYGFRTAIVWSLPNGHEVLHISNSYRVKPLELTFMDKDATVLMCSDTRDFRKLSLDDPGKGWQITYSSVFKEEPTVTDAFRNTPASVSFNNDVSQIAVAYRGAPLEVWDLVSGRIVKGCKRISRSGANGKQPWTGVNRVVWHPIDYEILGLYTDGVVFKWQPLTEAHAELTEALDSSPSDIQMAPNGLIFLTSDVNGTVKIHNFHDFVTIYQLSSEEIIAAMCFSPDSQRFYDIRGSYCNVWEPNALIRISASNDESSDIESEVGSLSSVSLMASEASVESSVPITSLAPSPKGSLVCFGDEDGTVTLCDIKDDSKLQIAASTIGMGVERIVWSDDGRYMAYEDLGRRMILSSLVEQRDPTSGLTWRLERILDTKSNLEHGMTKELLMRPDSSMLLSAGKRHAKIWCLGSHVTSTTLEAPYEVSAWSNNPQNNTQLLAFGESVITVFDWGVENLQKIDEWKIKLLSAESEGKALLSRVTITANGKYALLLYSQQERHLQSREFQKVRFIQTSSFDPSSKTVSAFHLPPSIAALVERPLTVLSSDLFVFIDESFWICTWHLDLETLLRNGGVWPADAAEGGKHSRIQNTETLAKLGVTRYFFLPRDWVNANSLALCTVLSDGTFLCPRKGEVAVIRSGLGLLVDKFPS